MNCPKCGFPNIKENTVEDTLVRICSCGWNTVYFNGVRNCECCNKPMHFPALSQKYCTDRCKSRASYLRKKARNESQSVPEAEGYGSYVHWEKGKACWIAVVPYLVNGQRKKFRSTDKATAIRKRDEFVAQTDGLFRIFDNFKKMCGRYGLTPCQFIDLVAPLLDEE